MTIVLILLSGLFDRMRGAGWFAYSHGVGMLGMGVCIGLLLGLQAWMLPAFLIAFTLGASPGWGNPLGAAFDKLPMGTNYEWWQVGILRVFTLEALLVRGLMWTAPALLFYSVAPGVLLYVPLAALAFPLSVYLARDIPRHRNYAWALMEFGRGVLMGLAAYLGGMYG